MDADPATASAPGQPAAPGQLDRAARPGRRQFLMLAGAAAGALPLAGTLASCARPAPRADGQPQRPAPGAADWAALQHRLSTGKLVRPGQPSYATAKQLFDPRFDTISPAAVAYCGSAADVSACLAFVRTFRLPVAARAGGHGYGGWSSSTGLVIDVTAMDSFQVNSTAGTVQVGSGLRLIDMYDQLAGHGLAVPAGSCPVVGVAGLTLGGGVGVLSRAYGLTSDNLQAVQVVTADGVVRDCDASQHSDLLWASQGGGGGNFGIATSFTFRTHQLDSLVLFFLSWPWSSAAQVMSGWQSWAPYAPDALWSNLHLEASPGSAPPTVQVGGTYLGSVSACQQLLSTLYAAVGSPPSAPYVAQSSYRDAMMLEAGCAQLSLPECHLPSQSAAGKLARQSSYNKSDFYTAQIPAAGIQALVSAVGQMQQLDGAANGVGAVAFDACGGVVNRVHPAATAFVHRDALFLAQYSTNWPTGSASAAVARQQQWLASCYAAMRPYASGQAYQNYLDPDLAGWQQAYYGANYPRLAAIKARYDPRQVFRFPQGITPA